MDDNQKSNLFAASFYVYTSSFLLAVVACGASCSRGCLFDIYAGIYDDWPRLFLWNLQGVIVNESGKTGRRAY